MVVEGDESLPIIREKSADRNMNEGYPQIFTSRWELRKRKNAVIKKAINDSFIDIHSVILG